jgi:uncharacterized protein
MIDYLTIIIKPTDACNAACVYCSAWKEKYKVKKMSDSALEVVYSRLAEYADQKGLRGVTMTWHGGEPLLVPVSFYERALEFQDKYLKGIEVENIMQTNLLALTEKKADMLKMLLRRSDGQPTSLGTSFDPVSGIRLMKNGDYDKRFFECLELLQSREIDYGIVYTTHKYSVDRVEEIYECFMENFPGVNVRFNPLHPEGKAAKEDAKRYHVTSEEWGRFLISLYRLWSDNGKKAHYNPLFEWDQYHYNGEYDLCCELSGNCASNHLGIAADGTAYICGRGIDRGTRPFGNLHENDLDTLLDSPHRRQMHNRRKWRTDEQPFPDIAFSAR